MAWYADVEWMGAGDRQVDSGGQLTVVRRGRVVDGAVRAIGGSSRATQQRRWVASAKAAVVPFRRCHGDVSAALAMAKLEGPLEPTLMLICCDDRSRWPVVLRYALAALRHRHGHEAATDAMHRLMWRRPVLPSADRAKSLRMRRTRYTALRTSAEGMFTEWADAAAIRFLRALG